MMGLAEKPVFCNTVNVRNPNTFGFQTQAVCSVVDLFGFGKRLKSEQICSVFRHLFLFEIRTNLCSNVRISDISLA